MVHGSAQVVRLAAVLCWVGPGAAHNLSPTPRILTARAHGVGGWVARGRAESRPVKVMAYAELHGYHI